MSGSSNKAIIVFVILMIVVMGGFFVLTQTYEDKGKDKQMDGELPSNSIKKETSKIEKIGEVTNIKLYVTDYIYNSSINGYTYTEVTLKDEDKAKFKDAVKDIELTTKKDYVVYGKFKLVLDDKIIYFDLDNDYALYSNKNIVFKLPNTTKTIIANSTDKCPCCKGDNCKINLCACSNN
jgi:hypothetical protein